MRKKFKNTSTETDFRYPQNWSEISRQIRQEYPICCLCHKNRSEEVHHKAYRKKGGGLLLHTNEKNKGKVGVHYFPLCLSCHDKAHIIAGANGRKNITYILHPTDKSFNRNTPAFSRQLKLGFDLLYGQK